VISPDIDYFAGNLAEKFGAKWILGGGILISGVLTLLTPMVARMNNIGLLVATRVITGMVCGPGFPSAAALWGKWVLYSIDHIFCKPLRFACQHISMSRYL
jgi:MFS family permease